MLRYVPIVLFAAFLVLVAAGVFMLRDRFAILGEFLQFLGERKMWWIAPMVVVAAVVGIVLVASVKSGAVAFIYTLF